MNRVITAQSDPEAPRAYWTMSRGNTERAFLAARRHSRLVRILRIAVPAAVSFALVVVILVVYLNPLRMLAKLPINIDNLVVSGTKVTMEQPRLSGFTRDARAYELTADTAAQDMTRARWSLTRPPDSMMRRRKHSGSIATLFLILRLDIRGV